jgi:para-aminobenzoate synthetase/4-amino-4-deoxychorismate lyase
LNHALLHDARGGRWLAFRAPREVVVARCAAEVAPALSHVDEAVEGRGLHAAGFIAYEAAPAFDPALVTRGDGEFPLVWFGLYDAPRPVAHPAAAPGARPAGPWTPSVTPGAYRRAFEPIRRHIGRGDSYQVNYTMRLRAPAPADPWAVFTRLVAAHQPRFGAFVETGDWVVCSASPELFFDLDGETIECRPMKGTMPRGRFAAEDRARARELQVSEKNRAENVMIVDMVRNDLGRIARPGSVRAPRLFELERYPTVWQMTSTVRAETRAPLAEILSALFPAASVTGAPKARSMQIIAELEGAPRRVYTGAVGFVAPGRRAQFNVAIRTVLVDRARAGAEYGVGGGIVWDSRTDDEYEECLTKARVLHEIAEPFDLVETMRWTPGEGCGRLERHLERLAQSAEYFGFGADLERVRGELARGTAALPAVAHRVRVRVTKDGGVTVEASVFAPDAAQPRRVAVASAPIDSADVFLFHKTTRRRVHDHARAQHPGADDVLLWNERGEVTESTIANVVVEVAGGLVTPPLACGLLPGVHRAELLERGVVRERVLTLDDVRASSRVYLVNSLRGMWEVEVGWGHEALLAAGASADAR